ncbi:pleckstrin homology domain-containing family A member 5-like isoform X5 [Cheilinus undulatus]|uniref:pleckstrin homology domain-containing family A member 5-like isoform X5 n=1 Tax=Cheilinus undulatus TaxID=241271 RepID=UPI001BD532AF|nr:pleckstrin homology domain-containing family A member 5-like isoform X5 [Cheilinus undulatus]
MAADPKPDWLSCLPSSWSYGVTRDGRIFFINEEAKSTTWLHPVTGEAVITGHRKTPDLPTGWEEGYTFEGARCFINHNERKVTCKHPVSGVPSQDNCIFVVNEHMNCRKLVHPDKPTEALDRPAPKASSEQGSSSDKKERPMSTMSEASNYTGGSDYSTFPGSPATTVTTGTTTTTSTSSTRPSRSSKKVHNFGKRSNSIKRNPNAPVVKSNWLYKQDSTGMKLWKKRWFVLSDMCLFYYRDEKEDSILGSILLPSFHISMLSVDDHISRKYAFKATHPNMRTYYFCTDTAKEMESWMKVMTDAALVHTEPVRRMDKLKVDQRTPQELNNLLNHRVLTRPEIQNNERNREPLRQHSLSRVDDKRRKEEKHNSQREREYYTLQRDGERYSLKKDGVSYTLQKDGERYLLHKDGEKYLLRKDGDKTYLHKDGEVCAIHRELEKYAVQKVDEKYTVTATEERYAPSKDGEKYLLTKDGEKYALQKVGDRHMLQKDVPKPPPPHKEVKRQLSLKETERYSTMKADSKYGTIQVVDKYGTVREVKKYATLREGDKYAMLRDSEKYATVRGGDKYGFQRDPSAERTLTKISSIKLQPAQAAAIAAAVSASRQANLNAQKPVQVNGSGSTPGELTEDCSPAEVDTTQTTVKSPVPVQEPGPGAGLSRTNSMQQLEQWVRTHRTRGVDDDARSVTSYQTLPRNMPSHRAQIVPRYPEGYRTLPRNSMMRPDSICSVAGSVYDRALRPASTSTVMTTAEKRRSMRDDTMWQLYEWQQRQAFSRQSLAQPTAVSHYGTLPSTKTMGNISEHAVAHSIPTSPSHGSLALYSTFSPPRQQVAHNPSTPHSEVSSPVFRGDVTLDPRHRAHLTKYGFQPDRRSIAGSVPAQTITAQSLQGKTPEELTLMLIKLRRQQAELNSLREHTVAQLMALGLEGPNAKTDVLSHHLQRNLIYLESQTKENEPLIFMIHTMIENSAPRPQLYQQISPEDYKDSSFVQPTEEADIDTKLSRLCEQDKTVRMQEEKLQQLHREKHTLETALLSASQELSEQGGTNAAATQSLIQQRDVLQNGLLSTCRELTRVSTELERSWREYDRLGADVTLAKTNLLEQLEALGSPQTEPPSQRHIQIQKELWRIQDVMEALAKNKPQRSTDSNFPGSKPLSSQQKNEQAPDYRLYKSEPELTTVKEEVDEANGEDKDKTETSMESKEPAASKAPPYPVGIVPPRAKSPMSPPESSTIASYVTLRKTKKPEPRSDRPRSAVDQMGYGEREVGRTRMSVEEQLERMRRNAEATSLREKRRETPSRSPSFSKDNPFLTLQNRVQADGACADPVELEAALQQLKVSNLEQSRDADDTEETDKEQTTQEVQRVEEVTNDESEEVQQDEDVTLQSVKDLPTETNSIDNELCESQRVVILDLHTEPQRVEIVNFQPFEDDESRDQDLTSSPTNTTTENSFQTPEPETPSPEPREEEPEVTPQNISEEKLEKSLDSNNQLTADDKKLNNNNNNMLPAQTFTLVSSDT